MKEYTISYGGPLDRKESDWEHACGLIITPTNPPGEEFHFNIYLDRSTCRKLSLEKDLEWILLKYGFKKTRRTLKESEDARSKGKKPIPLDIGDFEGFPEISSDDIIRLKEFKNGKAETITV